MLKKFLIIASALISLTNCAGNRETDSQEKSKSIEREDHQKCASRAIDSGDWSDNATTIYWKCRYDLIENRRVSNAKNNDAEYNNLINTIKRNIVKNLNQARQLAASGRGKTDEDNKLSILSKPKLNQYLENIDQDRPIETGTELANLQLANHIKSLYPACKDVNFKTKLFNFFHKDIMNFFL